MAEPLKKQATASRLHQLAQHGLLDAPALERALEIIGVFPSKRDWQQLINRLLLFLGVALVLAGIIFFFAYNWAEMGKFLKFALLEAIILLAVIGAWRQPDLGSPDTAAFPRHTNGLRLPVGEVPHEHHAQCIRDSDRECL